MKKLLISIILLTSLYSKSTIFYINKYSRKYKVDNRIVKGLINIESQGNPKAVSKKQAHGLCQIMLVTAREYYKDQHSKSKDKYYKKIYLFWAKCPDKMLALHIKKESVNIAICCWELNRLLKIFKGNYLQALNAYIRGVSGGKKNTAWDYVYKIINEVVNFKE